MTSVRRVSATFDLGSSIYFMSKKSVNVACVHWLHCLFEMTQLRFAAVFLFCGISNNHVQFSIELGI